MEYLTVKGNMKKLIILHLVFVLLHNFTSAQGFIDVTSSQGIEMINNGNSLLGVGLSFYDFDKDGWDDLTYSSSNDSLVVYRNLGGTGFERMELFPFTTDAKQPTWVDYDNDGDADIMWSKRSSGTKLFRNDGNMQFTDVTANLNMPTGGPRHAYGYSWGDYNKDGWLDVYVCLYNSEPFIRNYLLRNNGDGTFSNVATAAGVDVGAYLSLQSVWMDVNEDSWPDLYVINEGQENHLFINDGDGTFTNMAAAAGVLANIQSMTNSWNDYDHDGDWDVYITEALFGNILFRNNGNGTFTNVAAEAGVTVGSYCWGAKWIDFDHDTWDDLHVTTATNILNQDFFYINNGDGTFTDAQFPIFSQDLNFTYASAKGDFDHDGFWDMSVTRMGNTSYQLLQGIPTENNWVKLSLQGTHSNRDAIGANVDYYIGGTRLRKYTKCGEDYLSQNSQHDILSLGTAESIDSLIITWPRGLVEKFYNIPAGEWLELIEGENTTREIVFVGATTICPDQPATLDAGEGASYLWNTEEVTRTIDVSAPGLYTVEITDNNGYVFMAELQVENFDEWDVAEMIDQISCSYNADGAIEIMSGQEVDILWSDGAEGFVRQELQEGNYEYTLTSTEGCTYTSAVQIIAPAQPVVNTDVLSPLCSGGSDGQAHVLVEDQQATIIWSDGDDSFIKDELTAGTYLFTVFFGECLYEMDVVVNEPDPISFTYTTQDVSCFGAENGEVNFEISGGTGEPEIILSSGISGSLPGGDYTFEIRDQNDCSVFGEFTIAEPALLTASIQVTNANNGSNGSAVVTVDGGTEPYEYLWSNNLTTPEITGIPQGNYTCQIIDANDCLVTANASVIDVKVSEIDAFDWNVYPNPAKDFVRIEGINEASFLGLSLYNLQGSLVRSLYTKSTTNLILDLSGLTGGDYYLTIMTTEGHYSKMIMIR